MKFLVCSDVETKNLGLFDDLYDYPECRVIECGEKRIPTALKVIRKIHLSKTLNRIVKLPLKHMWYKLPKDSDFDEETVVVFRDVALRFFPSEYIDKLIKAPHKSMVCVVLNAVNAQTWMFQQAKDKVMHTPWDYVYSFDKNDAHEFNWKLFNNYYSKRKEEVLINKYRYKEISDAYFVGYLKGNRTDLILSIFKKLYQNDIKSLFHLGIANKDSIQEMPFNDAIHYLTYETRMPYEEILAEVINTNTIIEVVQENQTGASLRYFEAVCYNKKLLTNCDEIVNLPFYNPNWMKIFHDPEEIDIEWVRRREDVDYGYSDEFSPVCLLKQIELDIKS